MQQNFASTPLNYAGIGVDTVKYIPRGEQTNNFSINSYLINKDYFLEAVTGNSLYNLYVARDKTDFGAYFSLISGYFNSFESSYSVGSVAEVNVNGIVVGDAGKISTGSMNSAQISDITFISTGNHDVNTNNLKIPDIGSITLNIDEFSTNRLLSYNIRIESNKRPIYFMGNRLPKRVENLYPINVDCNFTFEPGDYEDRRLRNFPQSGIVKNLTVTVNDYNGGGQICSYSFNNLNLISENKETSVNGNVTINQQYNAKIMG